MRLGVCVLALVALTMAEEAVQLFNKGNTDFTAKMFNEVIKENPNKSAVLSAFSVLTPLAQLSLASVGESHDELLNAIGLPNDNVTKEVFPIVTGQLRAIKGVELKMANKVYIPIGYELNEQFGAVSRDVFGSEVKNVDFTKSVATAKEINEWVEDQTNHRIKDLVSADSLDSDTRAVLVNAIYFKGSWKEKFDKEATTDRDFHVTKETTIKVPTMYKKADFLYAESKELDAKLLEMPYEGGESSFLIVLPNEIDGLSALTEKLKNPLLLEEATKHMRSVEVNVHLPKFKIETTTDLKKILSQMGVTKLFDPVNARLEHLLKSGSNNLYVSEAIQKAFIEVNEEGAEAAAANEFGIVGYAAFIPQTIIEFDVNHPFIFILKVDQRIIFNGVFHS